MIPILFAGFSALLLLSALMVVLHRNPVTSALFLVVAFCALAGIYIVMKAEFIGMVQVIVYAGAIMVLFVFVIMYLNLSHDLERGATIVLRRMIGWIAGAIVLLQAVLVMAGRWALGPISQVVPPPGGNTQVLGQVLYTRFLFPFEITSLILLVAMVGAIVLSKGKTGRGASPKATLESMRRQLPPGVTLTPPPGGQE